MAPQGGCAITFQLLLFLLLFTAKNSGQWPVVAIEKFSKLAVIAVAAVVVAAVVVVAVAVAVAAVVTAVVGVVAVDHYFPLDCLFNN